MSTIIRATVTLESTTREPELSVSSTVEALRQLAEMIEEAGLDGTEGTLREGRVAATLRCTESGS